MDGGELSAGLRETMTVFREADRSREPRTTSEIAAELDISRRSTYDRLERLADRGLLETKKVGAKGRVWWPTLDSGQTTATDGAGLVETDQTADLELARPIAESLFGSEEEVVYAVTDDGRFARWNDRLRAVTGYSDDEIAEMHPLDLVAEDARETTATAIQDVLTDGESRTIELPIVTADGERRPYELSGTPIRNDDGEVVGLIGIGRDVTDHRETERTLQRQRDEVARELEDVYERVDDAFFALDEDWQFTYVNDRATEVLNRSASDLVGQCIWDAFPAVTDSEFRDHYERAVETQESVTFESYYPPLSSWFEVSAYPSADGLSVYFRDVTRRKARQRELERYEAIVQTMNDGVYVMDEDGRFVMVNDAFASLVGYDRTALLGMSGSELVDDETIERVRAIEREMLDGERESARVEASIERADGDTVEAEATFALLADESEPYQRVAVVRDVTDRRERERALAESRRRYRALVENFPNGAVALVDEDLRYVTVGGTPVSREVDSAEELEGRHVRSVLPSKTADAFGSRYEAALAGESSTFELELDGRFAEARVFPVRDDDGEIIAAMGVSQDVTELREHERELVRQREQLAALNDLHEVVHGVTDAVLAQSTREEIERTACERLVAADSYDFAWIAQVDPRTADLDERVAVGADGFLDAVEFSVDPDEAVGRGPMGSAVRTGEMQVSRDVRTDPRLTPWREAAQEHGFSSVAAIPIVHEGTQYGVLGLYSDRSNAFASAERAVVGQLGEVIGHAIAAAERKRALLSEEVVNLEFRVPDAFEALGVDAAPGGRLTFDQTVPLGDDEFLVYGHATAEAAESLRTLVDGLDHWQSVSMRGGDDPVTFELRLSEPPVLSTLASMGGSIEEAVIENGDYSMVLQVSSDAETQRLVRAVQEAYPNAEMMTRRQLTKADDPDADVDVALEDRLTERQLASLRAAYHAGFFEWPRDTSGESLAESLDVAPPTFHQHLRKAELKVFDALLGEEKPP